MDQRLLEASRCGDVGALETLLQEDPFILQKVSLSYSAETPLHVASLAGHVGFVTQIVRLKPSFASDLNKAGFTPLHMAAAEGQLEIATELLAAGGPNLCLLTDKGGRTPLHHAATSGRVTIIDKLLCECPEAFERVTISGDTALRLAVKNSQFEAFKILFEFSEKLHNHEERMMRTLELAIASKQLQVIDLLIKRNLFNNLEIIENLPLDVRSQMFPTDEEIVINDPSRARKQKGESRFVSIVRMLSKSDTTPVMASVIAQLTYQGLFSPPGVIWKEGTNFDTKCLLEYFKSYKWLRLLLPPTKEYKSCPSLRFYSFMFSNTVAFLASVLLIGFHRLLERIAPALVILCITFLIGNYGTLLLTMSPNSFAYFGGAIYVSTLIGFPPLIIWPLRRIISRRRGCPSDSSPQHRANLPQQPVSAVEHSDEIPVTIEHQAEARV